MDPWWTPCEQPERPRDRWRCFCMVPCRGCGFALELAIATTPLGPRLDRLLEMRDDRAYYAEINS